MSLPALDLRLERRLPGFRLDLHLRAGPGVTALFGPSGAGKTMVVDAIAGLNRPDAGWVRVGERVLFDSAAGIFVPPERRRIGYVFQNARLFPHLSVAANLRYGLRLCPRRERRIGWDEVVALLDLASLLARRPHHLSGGERRRVAIGRALLASPRLLLMDEPLTGLDPARRAEVLGFLDRLRAISAVPIVYVSHHVEEIVRLADRVAVLRGGRLVAFGPVEEVFARADIQHAATAAEAGAVLAGRVLGHDARFDLSEIAVPGGRLWVARIERPVGAPVRVHVHARDVALALAPPNDVSILNILPGSVETIVEDTGPQVAVAVALDGRARLWARLTRRSAVELGLAPGRPVWALIKSVALDLPGFGPPAPDRDSEAPGQ